MKCAAARHERSSDGAVHRLVLDGPPANIVGSATCAALSRALDEIAGDREAKLVVLAGEGANFSFGASVEEHLPEHFAAMLEALGGVVRRLVTLPVPTLAAVRGRCLGGGFELALACGIIAVEEGALLGSPEIRLGVFAPAATALLAGRVPRAVAEDILLSGRDVPADEAVRLGLATRLVPEGTLDQAVDRWADEQFRPRSAASLRAATTALRAVLSDSLNERLADQERRYANDLMKLADATEGIRAFLERRPPQWENR